MRSWRKRLFPVLVVLCLGLAFLASPAYAAEVHAPAQHTPTQSTSKQVTPHTVAGGGCYNDGNDSACISLNVNNEIIPDVYLYTCFQGFKITVYVNGAAYAPISYPARCSGHFYGIEQTAVPGEGWAFWTCLSGTLRSGQSEHNCSPAQYT